MTTPNTIEYKIESILGGHGPTQFFASKDQYNSSVGIDPDMPATDSDVKISGLIRPTSMEKFSGSTVTGSPMWLVTNPKDANIYAYASDGKAHSISSSLSMNSDIGTLTSASGNGAAYYDNYIYFVKNTDVDRYGPLNGTPALVTGYWSSTLSLTALTNPTYPALRGVSIPNHPIHHHSFDNKLYIGDVLSSGRGVIHFIRTSKSSVEGDTNDGSSHNALDLGYGYYPTCIASYGNELAIAGIEGTSTVTKQRSAWIVFWDGTSASYTKIIQDEFPDPLITAMKNINGVLYVFSGSASGGYRISRFLGGYSFQEVYYSEEGLPPFQGAVDSELNRVIWGSFSTYPSTAATVHALGSRKSSLGGGVHSILKTSSSGANPIVTAVKYAQHSNFSLRQPIVGWRDDSSQGVDKVSTTYGTSIFRSQTFRPGKPYVIRKITLPFTQAVAANMGLVVKVYTDNLSSNTTVKTINSTTYPNSERQAACYTSVNGVNDFIVELSWTGTALLTVGLPITIEVDLKEN